MAQWLKLIFTWRLLSPSYTVCKEIRVTTKIRVHPSGTLSKMLDLESFITAAGRAKCRQAINTDNNGMFIALSPYKPSSLEGAANKSRV